MPLHHAWFSPKRRKWFDIGMDNFWQHRYAFKIVPEGAQAAVADYIRTQKERPQKYER